MTWDLDRFVTAQEGVYPQALGEIGRGAKRGHWMWFIFPQIAGLGHSAMARHYALDGVEEARAYLAHRVLGPRLRACVAALDRVERADAAGVFGPVDAMKLRSSLTLFDAARAGDVFGVALARWFGAPDRATLDLLASTHKTA